jgi:hypothetical protein
MKKLIVILSIIACAISAHGQSSDSSRFIKHNSYGDIFPRTGGDSVLLIPVKGTINATPYRRGALRFNPVGNVLEVYAGNSIWVAAGNGGGSGSYIPPNSYTEYFVGTPTNFFSVVNVPIQSTIVVSVNGQRVPKTAYTVTNKAIQINSSALSFSTGTEDQVEIFYQSTN